MNKWFLKKTTKTLFPSLVTFNSWISWTTSVEQQVFINSWNQNKISEAEGFFPCEWFDHMDKMQNTEIPSYDAFYSKLDDWNPPED